MSIQRVEDTDFRAKPWRSWDEGSMGWRMERVVLRGVGSGREGR